MMPLILSKKRATLTDHYAVFPAEGIPPSTLPNFFKTNAYIQTSPEIGKARFAQMLLELEPGGGTKSPINDNLEHFIYILDGSFKLEVDNLKQDLTAGNYVYIPSGTQFLMNNKGKKNCQLEWIKRPYENIGLPLPSLIVGDKNDKVLEPYPTIPNCYTQYLLPEDDLSFDISMKILSFEPGVYFDVVETHVNEHGLYMLKGQGIYYLGDKHHEVQATDYIWMAPFCPQFFFCTGWERGSYLLYKNINRDIKF